MTCHVMSHLSSADPSSSVSLARSRSGRAILSIAIAALRPVNCWHEPPAIASHSFLLFCWFPNPLDAMAFHPSWLSHSPLSPSPPTAVRRHPHMCSASSPHLKPRPRGRPRRARRQRGPESKDDTALPWFSALDFRATIALVPPTDPDSSTFERLQEIRRDVRAIGLYRWPPHINICYPFLPPRLLETLAPAPQLIDIVTGISHLPAFYVRLRSLDIFVHKRSVTLIMCPETSLGPDGPWAHYRSPENMCSVVHRAVQSLYPDLIHSDRPFRPHMSVARFGSLEIAQEWQAVISEELDLAPITFVCNAAHILARRGSEPFQGVWDVPLRREGDDPRAVTIMSRSRAPDYYHPHLHELYPCEYSPPPKRRVGKFLEHDFGRRLPSDRL